MAYFQRLILVSVVFVFSVLSFSTAEGDGKKVFLWEVVSPEKAKAYLLGSIHAGRPDLYPLDERIDQAFEASQMLAVEVNVDSISPTDLMKEYVAQGVYSANDSLKNHVSQETYALVISRLQEYGLPVPQMQRLKPWVLALMISSGQRQALGIKEEFGLERYFLDKAKGVKPVIDLEYAEDQLALLSSFSEKEQEEMLLGVLKEPSKNEKMLENLMDVWKSGDDKKLEALLRPWAEDPSLSRMYKKIFNERNQKMADQIKEFIRTGTTVFVVVGAGHLVGEGSVVDILQREYKVNRL